MCFSWLCVSSGDEFPWHLEGSVFKYDMFLGTLSNELHIYALCVIHTHPNQKACIRMSIAGLFVIVKNWTTQMSNSRMDTIAMCYVAIENELTFVEGTPLMHLMNKMLSKSEKPKKGTHYMIWFELKAQKTAN